MSGKRDTLSRASVPEGESQMRVGLMLLSIVTAIAGMLQSGPVTAAQRKKILDKPVEYFETGLAIPLYTRPYWIDSRQLLITALPRGVKEDDPGPPTRVRTRVLLVNFALKRWQEIAADAAVMGFDQETLEAVIGARDRKTDARQIRITPAGDVIEMKRVPPGEPLPPSFAELPRDQLGKRLPHKSDGYLLADKTKLRERLLTDRLVPTTWVRPGKPVLSLPIRFEEIGPEIIYVDFLGKYLLNELDSQMSSDTNARMNQPSLWQRPYALTPFRLLSADGTIEEIPYPKFVFDYDLGKFSEFRLTRAGIVISQVTWVDGAIYLFQSGQLFHLTRKGGVLRMFRSLPMSMVDGLVVSPDGCSIAYSHYDVSPIQVTGTTPRYLSIVNVCPDPSPAS